MADIEAELLAVKARLSRIEGERQLQAGTAKKSFVTNQTDGNGASESASTVETTPSSGTPDVTNAAPPTLPTPEGIVKQLQNEGIPAKEIARRLDELFTNSKISNAALGRLLPANPGTIVSIATARSQGKRLRGKK